MNGSEPIVYNGNLRTLAVRMPIIVKPGKYKKWKGFRDEDFEDKAMIVENCGYADINNIDWGYAI